MDLVDLYDLIDTKVDTLKTLKSKKEKSALKIEINKMMDEVEQRLKRKIYKRL